MSRHDRTTDRASSTGAWSPRGSSMPRKTASWATTWPESATASNLSRARALRSRARANTRSASRRPATFGTGRLPTDIVDIGHGCPDAQCQSDHLRPAHRPEHRSDGRVQHADAQQRRPDSERRHDQPGPDRDGDDQSGDAADDPRLWRQRGSDLQRGRHGGDQRPDHRLQRPDQVRRGPAEPVWQQQRAHRQRSRSIQGNSRPVQSRSPTPEPPSPASPTAKRSW